VGDRLTIPDANSSFIFPDLIQQQVPVQFNLEYDNRRLPEKSIASCTSRPLPVSLPSAWYA
jgi:hypothetical protein